MCVDRTSFPTNRVTRLSPSTQAACSLFPWTTLSSVKTSVQSSNGHDSSHAAFSSSVCANLAITSCFTCRRASLVSLYCSGLTTPRSGNKSPNLSRMPCMASIPRSAPSASAIISSFSSERDPIARPLLLCIQPAESDSSNSIR